MTIYGWDASDYDWDRGPMNLVSAKAAGVSFFTYKITEGTKTVHKHCGEALQRARDAGIEFLGAYIVIRTGDVSAQVDFMLQQLDKQVSWWRSWPGWFFQVDLERWSYDSVDPSYGVQCCEEIRRRTGRWVVLYAPEWAYGDTITGQDPLWASNYGKNPNVPLQQGYPGDNSSRWDPYSGRTPVFLQYGSELIIGTQNWCDGNAYRGTIEQLRALITTGEQPPMALGDRTIREGDQGSDVWEMQRDLQALGYAMPPSANWGVWERGGLTTAGVKKFQGDHGLTVDGVCGPQTSAAIIAAYNAIPAPEPEPEPEPEPGQPCDLTPVLEAISALSAQVAALRTAITAGAQAEATALSTSP